MTHCRQSWENFTTVKKSCNKSLFSRPTRLCNTLYIDNIIRWKRWMPFTLMADKKRGVKQKKKWLSGFKFYPYNSWSTEKYIFSFFFCFRAAIRAATRGLNETGEAVEIYDLTPQNNVFFVNRFLYHWETLYTSYYRQ